MAKTAFHSYFGGKNTPQMSSGFICLYTPQNIKTYCEPFSGSFGIYFKTYLDDNTKVIYNDWNKDQANLFHCSKNYEKLLEKIEYHLTDKNGILFCPIDKDKKIFYKELYYATKKSDFPNTDFDIGDYDRATMYIFLLTSAFNSVSYTAGGFSGFNKDRMKLLTFVNKLNNEDIRKKLNGIDIVENDDFENIIKKYDSVDTYFYIDAPYCQDDGVKEKGNKRLEWYGVESEGAFGPSSHKRLCDLLKTIKGKFAMSYYDFPELSEWLPKDEYKWVQKDFFRSSASFSDNKDVKGTELLIMNYELTEEEYQKNYDKYSNDFKSSDEIVVKKKPIVTTLEEFKKMDNIVVEKENIIEKVTPKKETDDFWD